MQTNINSPPQLVLNPNTISASGAIAVRDYAVSPDGRYLAYNTSPGGADEAETHVRQLSNGRDLNDVVYGVINSVCWTQDGRGFFYPRRASQTPAKPTNSTAAKQFWYHVVGQPQRLDQIVLEWTKPVSWVYCMLSEDGRYALMVSESGEGNEIYFLDLKDPRRPDVLTSPILLLPKQKGFHTPIDIVGSNFYLRTHLDAPKGQVIAIDLKNGAQAVPRNIVSESDGVIESAIIAGNRIAIHYLVDVQSRLRLFTLDGEPAGEIALPGIGSVEWPVNGRPSKPEVFYSVVSFLAPGTVYRYDINKKVSTPFRPSRIPFDSSAYETNQIFYSSKDGTRVPMFITAAKNLKLNGTHPVLLTAYGGYGASLPPNYHSDIPIFVVVVNMVKAGIRQVCSRKNKIVSTISSPPPSIWSQTVTPRRGN
jgi:prolyl oligopeptidase